MSSQCNNVATLSVAKIDKLFNVRVLPNRHLLDSHTIGFLPPLMEPYRLKK